MEKTDKYVCVLPGFGISIVPLTLNKVYDGKLPFLNYDNGYITVVDDEGNQRNFKSDRFVLLSDYRINRLNEIGI